MSMTAPYGDLSIVTLRWNDHESPERFSDHFPDFLATSGDQPGRLAVLVTTKHAPALRAKAGSLGYAVLESVPVTEPLHFCRTPGSRVVVMRHPDGWRVDSE